MSINYELSALQASETKKSALLTIYTFLQLYYRVEYSYQTILYSSNDFIEIDVQLVRQNDRVGWILGVASLFVFLGLAGTFFH